MATLTRWTLEDLAVYCEHCMVIAVADGDKYCDDCANDVAEYLAAQYDEQEKIEKGWY